MDWSETRAGKMIDGEKEPYFDGIGFEILLNQASILCNSFFPITGIQAVVMDFQYGIL